MTTLEVTFENLDEVLKKLSPELYAKPLGKFLERCGIATLNRAKTDAPVDTGRLRSSLSKGAPAGIWDMDHGSPPGYLVIGTNVNRQGFYYPRALDESARYHYVGGKSKGRMHAKAGAAMKRGPARPTMGAPTKGWFSDAPEKIKAAYDKAIDKLRDEIAARWSK